jgi:hypothetical protein
MFFGRLFIYALFGFGTKYSHMPIYNWNSKSLSVRWEAPFCCAIGVALQSPTVDMIEYLLSSLQEGAYMGAWWVAYLSFVPSAWALFLPSCDMVEIKVTTDLFGYSLVFSDGWYNFAMGDSSAHVINIILFLCCCQPDMKWSHFKLPQMAP